jgi:small-conductance mechanosensitive channel
MQLTCGIARLAAVATLAAMSTYVPRTEGADQAEVAPPASPAVLQLWNRDVVTFRATVSGAQPAQRVRNARSRLQSVLQGVTLPAVLVRPAQVGTEAGMLVFAGEHVVFGLVPGDVDPEAPLTLEQTAAEAGEQLQQVLNARAEQRQLPTLIRGIVLSLLALIALVVSIRLILAIRERIIRLVDRLLRGRQLAIAGIDILPTLSTVERATFRVLSWLLIGACLYVALTYILHLFPLTVPLGQRLGEQMYDAFTGAGLAIADAAPSVAAAVGVLLVTRAVALWVSRVLAEIDHGVRTVAWLEREQARATRSIATLAIWVIGIAMAYPLLPWSGSRIFQGMSVVLGLGLSLASTGLVTHWISGLVLLYTRSFRVGDYVTIAGTEGVVTEIGALATKLRTLRREEITIPNAVLTSDRLTNHTRLAREDGAVLGVSLDIGYNVPWQQVRALLLHAAATTAGIRSQPAPRVYQWELSNFCVAYQLHVHLERPEDRIAVRSSLNARILDVFSESGVQIMTPHFESQPERPIIACPVALEA